MTRNLKTLSIITSAMLTGTNILAATKPVVLDLTKAETPLTFDAANGSWTGTFVDDEYTIDSQCFSFLKYSTGDYFVWSGFTASNSADNARYAEAGLAHQWSNMACGGIATDSDGNVLTDQYGAPVVDPKVPYMVGFYDTFTGNRPCDIIINDGKAYEAVGCYVNLTSYTHYILSYGDPFCRAFTHGDRLTLTAHGVHPDGSESTVDVSLASSSNGDLTRTRGWKYVDLTPLGKVDEIYFTMSSTDSGIYGMNTPGYFALDKLTVSPVASVESIKTDDAQTITYNRTTGDITLCGADFAAVYDLSGNMMMSHEGTKFNINHLQHGAYIVRAGAATRKIII